MPLEPRITPAFGVAGVLLMISGSVYLVIGIKNAWLQTFFSVGFLANLATTVLILYVMAPPVSDGIQGAYLVAVVLAGVILGVGSTIFKELTEGLACILGGFALSMWILTLVPGGLISEDAPKGAFIGLMSALPFGLFFSHYTRDFAMIGFISFGGATAVVIGIDCFTRAGLKEFWAYIWNLNEKLFPEGTKTHPITKGMRVESAAVIVFFLIGLISQFKLWRVIQDHRKEKEAEEAEGERDLQAEEEAVGRQVEERTARDRRAWERVYGSGESDADAEGSTKQNSGHSESGDLEKQTHVVSAVSTTQSPHSGSVYGPSAGTPPTVPPTPEPALMASGEGDGGRVMVRVVPDEFPRAPERVASLDPEEQAWAKNGNRDSQPVVGSPEQLRSMSMSPQPEVIPLPFQLNENEADGDADWRTVEARSSIAGTYDGEDERLQSMRSSLARRISQGSTNLLRSLSQRTDKNLAQDGGESQEKLVVRRSAARTDDDRGSLAANVDVASVDDARSTLRGDDEMSLDITGDMAGKREETSAGDAQQPPQSAQPNGDKDPGVPSAVEGVGPSEMPSQWRKSSIGMAGAPPGSSTSKPYNPSSGSSSTPVHLTRDALPEALSRTALKYRTNEWVKHSTTAEAPEPGDIYVSDPPEPDESVVDESPVPLNVDELQQTAMNGTPPPAQSPFRSSTAMSNYRALGRTSSGLLPADPIPEEPTHAQPPPDDDRSSSRTSASPPFRTRRTSASPGAVPFTNSQTLMGKRETYIRNKPLGTQTPLNGGVAVDYSFPQQTPSESPEHGPSRAHSREPDNDDDDMPLSHRRALIRRGSSMSFGIASPGADNAFNSHQPQRGSNAHHPAVREVQLANFRQSIQADLRAGTPMPSSRRESVLEMGLEAQRGMEAQRGAMLREKEGVARAREAERWGRERRERAFEEMVRSGELMGAHREAMRRLQGQARPPTEG